MYSLYEYMGAYSFCKNLWYRRHQIFQDEHVWQIKFQISESRNPRVDFWIDLERYSNFHHAQTFHFEIF